MLLNENIVNYKVVPNVLELRTSFLIVCIYMPTETYQVSLYFAQYICFRNNPNPNFKLTSDLFEQRDK
jgi:hypothetical protein